MKTVIIKNRYRLLLRVSAIVALIVGIKLVIHFLEWEVVSINPLFSGIIAANVFLMGFLLNGVLADFKESERLPGEVAASLETLAQEVRGIKLAKPDANISAFLLHLTQLSQNVLIWFLKKHRTSALLEDLNELTPHVANMEQWTQATLVARLKQELSNLRRMIIRIHTIRDTSFISSGYLLADIITVFLCLGLILVKIEPFFESIFFVIIISYFIVFLLLLIKDLDNPFGYYDHSSGEDVPLKPIEDALGRLTQLANVEVTPLKNEFDQ
jgi:predicted membrane chloride channel (bestrophin family)